MCFFPSFASHRNVRKEILAISDLLFSHIVFRGIEKYSHSYPVALLQAQLSSNFCWWNYLENGIVIASPFDYQNRSSHFLVYNGPETLGSAVSTPSILKTFDVDASCHCKVSSYLPIDCSFKSYVQSARKRIKA